MTKNPNILVFLFCFGPVVNFYGKCKGTTVLNRHSAVFCEKVHFLLDFPGKMWFNIPKFICYVMSAEDA